MVNDLFLSTDLKTTSVLLLLEPIGAIDATNNGPLLNLTESQYGISDLALRAVAFALCPSLSIISPPGQIV